MASRDEAAFDRHFPAVAGLLRSHPPDPSAELVKDASSFNVSVGGSPLYPMAADAFTRAQVEEFLRQPLVFQSGVDQAHRYNVFFDDAERALFDGLDAESTRLAQVAEDPAPVDNGYFFICNGLGLGFQLTEILRQTDVRHIVVVEPIIGFIHMSRQAFGWEAFLGQAGERGIAVDLVAAQEPVQAAREVISILRENCRSALDATLCMIHYGHPFFQEVLKVFASDTSLARGWGFFDDERNLLLNTLRNFTRPEGLRVLEPGRIAPDSAGSVVVVGSGPSLGGSYEALKQVQGKALILSCGSALLPLLKNGIRPDLHVEIEREPVSHNYLDGMLDEKLPLVTAGSVIPEFTESFDAEKTFFYTRSGMSPHVVTRDRVAPLDPCGFRCDHAALGVARALGASTVALVGVDLGSKDAGTHHVDGTFFEDETFTPQGTFALQNVFDIQVPGNFGGTVHTSWEFVATLREYEKIIQSLPGIRWLNASDGALIPGAAPTRDLAAVLGGDAAHFENRALEAFPRRPFGATLFRDRIGATIEAIRAYRLSDHLAARPGEWNGFKTVFDPFVEFFKLPALDPIQRLAFEGQAHQYLVSYMPIRKKVAGRKGQQRLDGLFLEAMVARFRTLEDDYLATFEGELTSAPASTDRG